ncbi:structural constituent of ribosome, partial [Dissophora globulifera]
MSGLPTILKATEEDIKLLLSAQSHLGTKNCDVHMEPYVWKRRADELLDQAMGCSRQTRPFARVKCMAGAEATMARLTDYLVAEAMELADDTPEQCDPCYLMHREALLVDYINTEDRHQFVSLAQWLLPALGQDRTGQDRTGQDRTGQQLQLVEKGVQSI